MKSKIFVGAMLVGLAVILFAGCSAPSQISGPVCGDGLCEAVEGDSINAFYCPSDCPVVAGVEYEKETPTTIGEQPESTETPAAATEPEEEGESAEREQETEPLAKEGLPEGALKEGETISGLKGMDGREYSILIKNIDEPITSANRKGIPLMVNLKVYTLGWLKYRVFSEGDNIQVQRNGLDVLETTVRIARIGHITTGHETTKYVVLTVEESTGEKTLQSAETGESTCGNGKCDYLEENYRNCSQDCKVALTAASPEIASCLENINGSMEWLNAWNYDPCDNGPVKCSEQLSKASCNTTAGCAWFEAGCKKCEYATANGLECPSACTGKNMNSWSFAEGTSVCPTQTAEKTYCTGVDYANFSRDPALETIIINTANNYPGCFE